MKDQLLFKKTASLALLMLLLTGCQGATPGPTFTPTVETDPKEPTIPTETEGLTEVPPTETETPIEPTATVTPTISTEFSDDWITINLDEVEKTDVLPDDIEIPPASEDHTYTVFHLTVTRIESVHLVNALGYGGERSILRDTSGQEYSVSFGQFKGVRFSDPTNLTSSQELIEGAQGILVFETPLESEPENLEFIYSYQESLDEESSIRGEILITF
jgi:hypothetical protein